MRSIVLIVLLLLSVSANAAQAYLVSCQTGTSFTGRLIYIGTYQYAGHEFQQSFTSWCPYSIEVY